MPEQEETQEKKRGKGKLFALLALVGAAVAFLTFWRRRGAPHEEE